MSIRQTFEDIVRQRNAAHTGLGMSWKLDGAPLGASVGQSASLPKGSASFGKAGIVAAIAGVGLIVGGALYARHRTPPEPGGWVDKVTSERQQVGRVR